MVTLLSMLFLFTKFMLIFELKYLGGFLSMIRKFWLFQNLLIIRIFQIIFNPLRSVGNKSSYILKAEGFFKYV